MKLKPIIYECPFCSYKSCLLGIVSHALSRHKVNILSWACRKHKKHRHRDGKGKIRYVIGSPEVLLKGQRAS